MNSQYILPLYASQADLATVGGKGASLTRLSAAGLPVPGGFHVTTAAYRKFEESNDLMPKIHAALRMADPSLTATLEKASETIWTLFSQGTIPTEVADEIINAYSALPGRDPAVAVRSSATAEDLPEASFAGQQETYLNVRGADAVLETTRKCWASLWTARAIDYRMRRSIAAEDVALAVVVQLLIAAEAAGILFTGNPVNGHRDQIVINASWGLGEAVVGGLVTPDTLTLDKSSGNVISRETSEKLIQTVLVDGGTQEKSVPVNLRSVPVLNDEQAAELARLGNKIEELYGMPMDIEWALADGALAIVQARPITALPEPEPHTPTEWKLPEGAYVAMRNNIVEMMVDPLTPLFRTLGLRAVNSSMDRLLTGFFGRSGIMPDEPIIAINEYAYYNGSISFVPMIKMILDTRGILKRMFTGAVERWTEVGRPNYMATVARWQNENWRQLTAPDILDVVRELSEAAIDAYGALISGVIPAAWMSEAWFTWTYKLVKRKGDPAAPTYLLGFDSLPIRAEKSLYDMAQWAKEHTELAAYLKDTPTQILLAHLGDEQTPSGLSADNWNAWQSRFRAHLRDYGHMIYNLDFGSPVPADDPAPVLETFKLFLSGQGVNPHERQAEAARQRQKASEAKLKTLKGLRLQIFQKNLARAQRYAPLREDGLADVGLSYPLLRQMLFELGRRFNEVGMIETAKDIFWLIEDEVEYAAARLESGQPLENLSGNITVRKAAWRAARRAVPPVTLFNLKIFGIDFLQFTVGSSKGSNGNTLKGVAASPGSVTAPATILHGPEDFNMMKAGTVLVASITTPAWTPLFARAAAIVTDVGGPLSHGSIVAREYGIPAVLGTGSATKRIQNGATITVDGSEGKVYLSPR
jgi:pyruvate,water dikinase